MFTGVEVPFGLVRWRLFGAIVSNADDVRQYWTGTPTQPAGGRIASQARTASASCDEFCVP